MKIKSKVRSSGNRKSVEIPKAVRNEFEKGEEVFITKSDDKIIKESKNEGQE